MSVHGLPEQPAFFRASLFADPPGIALLKKPFTDEQLVEAAATMIARPRGVCGFAIERESLASAA